MMMKAIHLCEVPAVHHMQFYNDSMKRSENEKA